MINVFRPQASQNGIVWSQQPLFPAYPLNYTVESLTRDVDLKPVHSHNDYWRKQPLFDALGLGIVSVEADIWHFDHPYVRTQTDTTADFALGEFYVGHNQDYLELQNTLNSLYLKPILAFLDTANPSFNYTDGTTGSPHLLLPETKNSVFYNAPEVPLYLWLDAKTDGNQTYNMLKTYLKPLIDANYLAYYDVAASKFVPGPVVVTMTGNVAVGLITEESTKRYIFADVPLKDFTPLTPEATLKQYASISRLTSASLEDLLGKDSYAQSKTAPLTSAQEDTLKSFFDLAHQYGLETRVWGGATWPRYIRNAQWKSLFEAGTDLVNADDLEAVANLF